MSRQAKKIAIIASISLVAIFATQAIMFVHLLCQEHHPEHDSHECPICRQLFTLPHNITVEQHTTIVLTPVCLRSLAFHVEVKPEVPAFHVSGPRAPPFYL